MSEDEVATGGIPVVAARTKLPRGFGRTKARLDRAIKEGASLVGLLGSKAHIGGRIRKGEAVRRSSLKVVEKALNTWESKKPVRTRAAKRAMHPVPAPAPVRKAAGSVNIDILSMVQVYLDATPEERQRFRTIIEALEGPSL